ncbi:MAG: threonylcarbamoyl-AMP synthase [endosymbiont of Galathealinum brachiosum]|uniref:Threonylcarbamoyl-AMP synthase n=1 Tax=endosymbiont of Galathealinum brachiosum TaxID=2200906 RepID=A0A370DD52_9GAMM|nr:MAG: threonylcarbamoyl-AMP synthase [endosymbiont of Galathealinum brachiosum]
MSSTSQIQQAARIILDGGIISYPTESVFGLGCDPLNEKAVHRILKLKNRSVNKGLIIVAGDLKQLSPYIEISENEKQKILNEKPVTTWLVNKSSLTPNWVSGKHKKVAVRISKYPLIINLCQLINQPLISTSANPAEAEPATTSQQSEDYFFNNIDLYIDDQSERTGQPSQIKDITTDTIIR